MFPFKDIKRSQKPFFFKEEDLFSDLLGKKESSLFLGKYTLNEVKAVLKKRGFFKEAQKIGLWPLVIEIVPTESPPLQRFQIFYKKKTPSNMIVDMKIKEGIFFPKDQTFLPDLGKGFRFLVMEWLTMQNPLESFSPERKPLPGQNYPGLGHGREVLDLFFYVARVNRNDGVLAFPAYFHNAVLFSLLFRFFNPEKEAEILAAQKAFSNVPFVEMAWIVHLNCLIEEGKGVYEWKAEEQVCPLNQDIKRYFDSSGYKEAVKSALEKKSFHIDWECYKKKAKEG